MDLKDEERKGKELFEIVLFITLFNSILLMFVGWDGVNRCVIMPLAATFFNVGYVLLIISIVLGLFYIYKYMK